MSVAKEHYGLTADGREISLYTIVRDGITAKVTDFGAILVSLLVPDRDGVSSDVVLGYDAAEGYFDNSCFFGATVGPNANRIANASFSLNGQKYSLPVNDGVNNLHTDQELGLHKKLWEAQTQEYGVTFNVTVPDGECGLPGNRSFSVTYSLTEQGGLLLSYHAQSDQETLINLTNHSYFNLAGHGAGSVLEQELKLFCSHYTPVVKGAIPTGEIRSVEGSPFDFTQSKTIGKEIDADCEQLALVGGYDHNFCVDGYTGDGTMRPVAAAYDSRSGRVMEVFTTLPGVQFYAGNSLDVSGGKDGAFYGPRSGFALETQFYPDSANEPTFPQPFFGPEHAYESATEYRFSVKKA
ncbi:MAG: aldose epimerase family protein [Eubacteriales bacterium]|nr:aldose epimerase family protein [Eubacteriales bacterium]